METVQIRHPKLERTITVPKSAVPHHMRAGWVPVEDEPAVEPEPAAEPAKYKPRVRKAADEEESD